MSRAIVTFVAVFTPTLAFAGPFSGFTALGQHGIDQVDASGLTDANFFDQIHDDGIVGPGIECEIIPPSNTGDFSDVDATLTVTVATSWAGFPFIFNGMRFTLTDPGAPSLEGAYIIATDIVGFDNSRVTSDGSRVALNFSGMVSNGFVTLGFPMVDSGPELDITGTCPGTIRANFSDFTPGGQIALTAARRAGSTAIPVGSCAGTLLDLAAPRLIRTLTADANGELALSSQLSRAVCGQLVQAVDLDTCEVTEVVQLP
jgi:hypothetical protein